ncbi:uncharacterized protein LOC122365710 [Amphibalanus amphitrite]|uniref:uncharacterized protein LOC122365710 n=1 Tax=Amphibalanus amphitrite TaxID=1232801 RepID=UPI001C90BB71|nr:uncharacterized protein LOC122365710 [Amphibalanus amphitrite]
MVAGAMVAGTLMVMSAILQTAADRDCYRPLASGRRLGVQFISRRYSETTLDECADKCLRSETTCRAFSYRQPDTVVNGVSVDLNCELTTTPVNGIERMLTVDADYETFEPVQSAACRTTLPGSSGNSAVESRDCFRRVITGRRLPTGSVRYSLRSSSLSRCQQSCLDADFFCTVFSYKTEYDTNEINCELSAEEDWETSLESATLFDTYEREKTPECGYYGGSGSGGSGGSGGRDDCFLLAERGRAIDVQDVTRQVASESLRRCQRACSQAPFGCQALSYRRADYSGDRNCQLSGRSGRLHTVPQSEYSTYRRGYGRECDDSGSGGGGSSGGSSGMIRCFRLNAPDSRLRISNVIRNVMTTTVQNCAEACKITDGCRSFSYRRDTAGAQLNCEMARVAVRSADDRAVEPDQLYDTYSREYGAACQTGTGTGTGTDSSDGCYRLVSSRSRLQRSRIDAVFSAMSRTECERICYMSYTGCRSFSYMSQARRNNCAVSREDAYPSRLEPDSRADTYQRDFSRACDFETEEGNDDECFRLLTRDARVSNSRTDNSVQAGSLLACQQECRRTGCETLSYRRSSFVGETNCRLSRDLLDSRDLIPENEHDAYTRLPSSRCDGRPPPGPPGPPGPSGPPGPPANTGLCFRMVMPDARLRDNYVLGVVQVTDLRQCEDECLRLRDCGIFSFRRTYSRTDNCLLSRGLGQGGVRDLLQPEFGWSSYQRDGRCQGPGGPPPPPPGPGAWTSGPPSGAGSGCYRLQRRDTRLENHILEVINSRELRDCEESCNRDRRCVSFNFRSDPVETVCELTDMDSYAAVAQFRPISGWDFYEKDASSYCSGWDNDYFDQHNFGYPYCSARVQDNSLLNVNAVRRDITARSLAECEQACRDERAFRCETFSFGVLPGGRAFSCHLTDLRVSELSPRDIEPAPSFEIYDFHGNGRECDRPNDQYDFRHGALETSSGRSCVRGPCRIDRSGGYWYCFTDVAEAVWDYCCDPDSQCQHDARMDMETCFVTQGRGLYRNAGLDTAWRPCSYRPGRYAYLTRNGTDHVVPDDTAANATDTANNSLLEPIDLTDERDKSRN